MLIGRHDNMILIFGENQLLQIVFCPPLGFHVYVNVYVLLKGKNGDLLLQFQHWRARDKRFMVQPVDSTYRVANQ